MEDIITGKTREFKPVYDAEAFRKKLKKRGKLITLDRPEDAAVVILMNKSLKKSHDDFEEKMARSGNVRHVRSHWSGKTYGRR